MDKPCIIIGHSIHLKADTENLKFNQIFVFHCVPDYRDQNCSKTFDDDVVSSSAAVNFGMTINYTGSLITVYSKIKTAGVGVYNV